MNIYLKNFGLWLGAPLFITSVLPFLGIYMPFLVWICLIGGTIVGIVRTHKDLGKRIEFGKAVGASYLIVISLIVFWMIVGIAMNGMPPMWYFMEYMLLEIFIKLILVISILLGAGQWYMFQKAGKEGWECIVPIYNFIVLLEIAKKPTWWVAMFFVPIANIVFIIMMLDGIAKNFGKTSGFTVGLVFLQQIFMAVLGYGSAQYVDGEKVVNLESSDLLDN